MFVALLLVSNIIAVKLVPLNVLGQSLVVPAGVIAYPLTFLAGDILTEVYGIKAARRTIYLGFAANILMVGMVAIAIRLPASPAGAPQDSFAQVLGMTPRIVLGSFVAYLAGELSNAQVMAVMRRLTQGRALWLRTIGSTIVGQALDTTIFITIAFSAFGPLGVTGVDLGVLVIIIRSQYLVKVAIEVVGTPLVYALVAALRRPGEPVEGDAILGTPQAG
jgi:uncharacterized integral membrane protein (TIGR00697 family)